MSRAAIFRTELLPRSETFILGQAAALREFTPNFVGFYPAKHSLELPGNPVLLSNTQNVIANIKGHLYSRTGLAPTFNRAVKSGRPDLIHAHFGPDGVDALPLAAALDIPLIVTLHGYDITLKDSVFDQGIKGRWYLKNRERLWQRATAFLCDSEFLRLRAVGLGFPEDKLRVHYIGINRSKFPPPVGTRDPNLILFVGRLVEKKGCSHLIRAVAESRKSHANVNLVLIGEGPMRGSLEKLSRELNLPCQFLGAQPQEVIQSWLSRARIFCAPSVTASSGDSEGFGIVFAEAQSSGTPVVSFRHGGIPEAVIHGETGLLAREGDNKSLANYLLQYLTDDSLWRACSAKGPTWVKERFDIERQTKALEELYKKVIGQKH